MPKKRKRVIQKHPPRTDDKSFLIIVGGGLLLLVLAYLTLRSTSVSTYLHMSRMMSSTGMGKTVVVIKDYTVEPSALYVKTGQTVYWSNQDNVAHTISATDNAFTTGPVYQGGEGSYTFTVPGTYQYYSTAYPNVRGVVYVE